MRYRLEPAGTPGRRLDACPDVLTVAETAVLLGVSRNLVWRAVARHQVRTLRIGRRVLVPRSALRDLLEGGTPR